MSTRPNWLRRRSFAVALAVVSLGAALIVLGLASFGIVVAILMGV